MITHLNVAEIDSFKLLFHFPGIEHFLLNRTVAGIRIDRLRDREFAPVNDLCRSIELALVIGVGGYVRLVFRIVKEPVGPAIEITGNQHKDYSG